MKAKEVHEMTNDELAAKLKELKAELFNLRFTHATGQLSNPITLSVVKRDIARVKTVMRQRELGIAGSPAQEKKVKQKA